MTVDTAISFSKLKNGNIITNVFAGIGLALFSNDYNNDNLLLQPIGFTINRETYQKRPDFDNKQIAVTIILISNIKFSNTAKSLQY